MHLEDDVWNLGAASSSIWSESERGCVMEKGGLIQVRVLVEDGRARFWAYAAPWGWDLGDPVARASLQCGVARGKGCVPGT